MCDLPVDALSARFACLDMAARLSEGKKTVAELVADAKTLSDFVIGPGVKESARAGQKGADEK